MRRVRYILCNETPCFSFGQWKKIHFLMKRGNERAQVLAHLGSSAETFLPCFTGDPDIIMKKR